MARKKQEAIRPLEERIGEVADWLEEIDESGGMMRRFRMWWNRSAILDTAIELAAHVANLEKKNGCHDKIRRSLNTMVMAMGGAELKWANAKAKDD